MTPADRPEKPEEEGTPAPAPSPRSSISGMGRLPWIVAIALGVLAGLGSFTFGYGEGAAYLSDDPAACAHCHVMQDHYTSWQSSSHRHVAVCNDCHLSHHPIGRWIVKADNGFFHSLAFTTGNFDEPIRIKPRNREVTRNACLHCHGELVHGLAPEAPGRERLMCVHCHDSVGHALR